MKTQKHKAKLITICIIILVLVGSIVTCFSVIYTQKESYGKQLELAKKYYAAADYDNAILHYQKAIKKEPERTEGYIGLAEVYTSQGYIIMAETILQLGIERTDSATMNLMVQRLYPEKEAEEVVTNNNKEEEKQEMSAEDDKASSNNSGRVLNAATGASVYKAKIKFYKGSVVSGTPVETVTTNSFGKYDVVLESGSYTAVVSCSGYMTESFDVYIGTGKSAPSENFVISPELKAGEIRIVLEWGSEPRDLDSYLDGTLDNGHNVHISYSDQTDYSNGKKTAELDVDDISGYGPETTTIYDVNGSFIFTVKDYHNTGTMASSGATVKIYLPDKNTPHIVHVPSTAVNSWKVCKIDHGELTVY